jgi:hypothetical protein
MEAMRKIDKKILKRYKDDVTGLKSLEYNALNRALPGRELLNYSRPGRVWLVTSGLGMETMMNFFFQCKVS